MVDLFMFLDMEFLAFNFDSLLLGVYSLILSGVLLFFWIFEGLILAHHSSHKVIQLRRSSVCILCVV